MGTDRVTELIAEGIRMIIVVSAPPLLIGLTVGVLVSIFQTVTSIQEPTLAFVPKILAVFLALVIFGPWMLTQLREYIQLLYTSIPALMSTI